MKRSLVLGFLFLTSSCVAQSGMKFKITDANGIWTALQNATTLSDTQTIYLPRNVSGKTFVAVAAHSQTQTYLTGDLLYANGNINFLSPLHIGLTAQVLGVTGGGPGWITPDAINTTHAVVNNPDGTTSTSHNRITPTVDAVPFWLQSFAAGSANLLNAIYDNGAGTNTVLTLGSTGALTLTPAADVVPVAVTQFAGTSDAFTIDGSAIFDHSLNLPVARLNSGISASSLTFWRGDGTWATVSSGGVSSFSAGTTGFTPNTATTGAVVLAGTLVAANGGTGQSTVTGGDVLFGSVPSGGAWSKLAGNASGTREFMYMTGTGSIPTAPGWTQPAFSDITGTASIAQGGTGQTTASVAFNALSPTTTDGDISYRNATTNQRLGIGSAYSVLQTDHVSLRPAWGAVNLSQSAAVTSLLGLVNGGTGIDGSAITDGQLLIGQTSDNSFGLATITAGANISVTNAGHSITIANTMAAGMSNPMTTTGDIIYASNTATPATPARLGIGASTTVLHGGTTPSYSQIVNGDITNSTIDLTAKVTGTLPVANGGSGLSSPTANSVLLTNGSSAFQTIVPSTSGNVLTSNGTTWASTAPTATYTVAQTIQIDNILTTSTDGLLVTNTTASDATNKAQWSPRIRLHGSAWKNATASQAVDGFIEMRSIPASTDVTPEMVFAMRSSTSAYDTLLTVQLDHSGSLPLYSIGTTTGAGRGAEFQVNPAQSTNGGDFRIRGQNGNGSNQGGGKLKFFPGRPTGNVNAQGFEFQAGYAVASGTTLGTEKIISAMTISGTAATAPTMKFSIGSSSTVTGILNVCQSAAANASCGTGTLAAGTLTVNTTAVATGDLIFLTDVTGGTNIGTVSVGTITNATSFVVTSTNPLDNSSFNWLIVRPN